MEKTFQKIGTFFATYPWYTLFAGLVFVVAMGCGIMFLEVTTDPVKLWASAQSRSRIEREFFDSNFQPFFRIEQVIITARNMPEIKHNTSNGMRTFGPVFDKEFLTKVYKIQEDIKALGTDKENGVTLKDICFAPLTDGTPGSVVTTDCVIQSIWGYFKDDLEELNQTDTENGYEVNIYKYIP